MTINYPLRNSSNEILRVPISPEGYENDLPAGGRGPTGGWCWNDTYPKPLKCILTISGVGWTGPWCYFNRDRYMEVRSDSDSLNGTWEFEVPCTHGMIGIKKMIGRLYITQYVGCTPGGPIFQTYSHYMWIWWLGFTWPESSMNAHWCNRNYISGDAAGVNIIGWTFKGGFCYEDDCLYDDCPFEPGNSYTADSLLTAPAKGACCYGGEALTPSSSTDNYGFGGQMTVSFPEA